MKIVLRSNIPNRKLFSDELSKCLIKNFGVKNQNLAIFDPFFESQCKSDQKIDNAQ